MRVNLSCCRLPFSFASLRTRHVSPAASHSSFTSTSCNLSICVSACISVFFTCLWLFAKMPSWLQPSPPVCPPISSPADPPQLLSSRGRVLSPTRRSSSCTSRQFACPWTCMHTFACGCMRDAWEAGVFSWLPRQSFYYGVIQFNPAGTSPSQSDYIL